MYNDAGRQHGIAAHVAFLSPALSMTLRVTSLHPWMPKTQHLAFNCAIDGSAPGFPAMLEAAKGLSLHGSLDRLATRAKAVDGLKNVSERSSDP